MQQVDIQTIRHPKLGNLSFFESEKNVPFSIQRMYYIYQVPREGKRGGHAHKKLRQLLFCPYGEVEITLDTGKGRETILLNNPSKGLIVPEGIWGEMIWKKENSVLCVAASDYYDESDYIRDYRKFMEYVEGRK